jgi:hypothetical protein
MEEKQLLDVKGIMEVTGLGKNSAYELLNSGEFNVIKIKSRKFVHKHVFMAYLKGENGRKKIR